MRRDDTGENQTRAEHRLEPQTGFFVDTQTASAAVLLAATIAALICANSPLSDAYDRLWHTDLSVSFGGDTLNLDLRHWVNDGLMALFFFVVGMEIRREFDMGELRERRRLAAPVVAAIGGMIVPALLYLVINTGDGAARGWGIVMGTDTAFALGVLALLGARCAPRIRIFLLTLVVVDDIVALTVIAVAYTEDLSLPALGVAAAFYALILVMRRFGVHHGIPYFAVATVVWGATLASGVHATIAGVAIGILATAHPPSRSDLELAGDRWRLFREQPTPELARRASRSLATAISPNERLQHLFHPWTSFVIVPVFAFANAGVELDGDVLRHSVSSPITIGIVVGLVVGKPLGIMVATWLASRPARGGVPLSVPWSQTFGAATVAGIGFTVSLLIADISFTGTDLDDAKVGILAASVLAAIASFVVFRGIRHLPERAREAGAERVPDPIIDLVDPVDPDVDHVRGPVDAPVVLVEYGDFECRYCGRAEPILRDLAQRFGDDLTFVFRHLPLVEVHEHAELAAEASEAAAAQGRFWEMHDVLMSHQGALTLDDLRGYAADLDLDVERFAQDLDDRRFALRVERDLESAGLSDVVGTPTLFVNGRRLHGGYDLPSLVREVQTALRARRPA